MDLGFADATAVVVGGGRGMGLATARCLAEDGARIAVIGRSADVLTEAADALTEAGIPAFGPSGQNLPAISGGCTHAVESSSTYSSGSR